MNILDEYGIITARLYLGGEKSRPVVVADQKIDKVVVSILEIRLELLLKF